MTREDLFAMGEGRIEWNQGRGLGGKRIRRTSNLERGGNLTFY